jgi:hypothetical protein
LAQAFKEVMVLVLVIDEAECSGEGFVCSNMWKTHRPLKVLYFLPSPFFRHLFFSVPFDAGKVLDHDDRISQ